MFEFNPDTHTYTLDGVQIPSVTQVLPYEFFDDKPDRKDVGQAIHRLAYLHNIGKSDIDIMTDNELVGWFAEEDNFMGYLDANKKFRKDHELEGIYDYKRNPYPATAIQLAGYHLLANEGLCDCEGGMYEEKMYHPQYKFAGTVDIIAGHEEVFAVYLKDNGTYKLENHTKNLRKNKSIFLSFLTCHRWRKENNI